MRVIMNEERLSISDEVPWCDELKFVLVNGDDAKIHRYDIDVSKEYYQPIGEYMHRMSVEYPMTDMKLYMIASSKNYGSVYVLDDNEFVKQAEFEM